MALNWGKDQQRRRVARQGGELANAVIPLFGPLAGGRRYRALPLPKSEVRAQAAEAIASYQGAVSRVPEGTTGASSRAVIIRCVCGHMASAAMPRKSARFRCSKCGRRQRVKRS